MKSHPTLILAIVGSVGFAQEPMLQFPRTKTDLIAPESTRRQIIEDFRGSDEKGKSDGSAMEAKRAKEQAELVLKAEALERQLKELREENRRLKEEAFAIAKKLELSTVAIRNAEIEHERLKG